MEFTSFDDRRRIKSTLEQIKTAIGQLKEWNEAISSSEDYYLSSSGMQKLAASCMLIEAIGEGIKKIDHIKTQRSRPRVHKQFHTVKSHFRLKNKLKITFSVMFGIKNHILGYINSDTADR